MRKQKIIYWISTGILSAHMILTGLVPFVSSTAMEIANEHVTKWGFPHFFHVQWEIAKILGGIALILPAVPKRIKEFAYSGFIILLVSALITHVVVKDPIGLTSVAAIFLIILAVSYRYYLIVSKEEDKR